jgi:diaminopimelate decarboxylase
MANSLTVETIAGIDVCALAQTFGTPLYVYDAATIRARVEDLSRFDTIRYAQKANANLAILALMKRAGVVVDAVSAGEIFRALWVGFDPTADPPGVVYTADVFDAAALDMVDAHRVPVNVGSLDMIVQLGERCPGRAITLRVNPGFGHGHSRKVNTGGELSKHGIWHEHLGEACAAAAVHGLAIAGLHLHIGSAADLVHLLQVCRAMLGAAAVVRECAAPERGSLQVISAGGGLPVPYRPGDRRLDVAAYCDMWLATRTQIEGMVGHSLRLEVEPGRYLVAEAGYLIAEVRAVKRTATRTFYLLDAGFDNLIRPALYGAYHHISICPRGDARPQGTQPVVVAGPLCEAGDVFTQDETGAVLTRDLPFAAVGDLAVIHDVGAYGFSMSSNYNARPMAAEVLIDDGQARLVRQRQLFWDLIREEVGENELESTRQLDANHHD